MLASPPVVPDIAGHNLDNEKIIYVQFRGEGRQSKLKKRGRNGLR